MTKNPPELTCPCAIKQVDGYETPTEGLPDGTTPLSLAYRQEKYKVCKINGDRKICARMAHLGVLPGSEIELICPGRSSQCMVRIMGCTMTLDQAFAENILVTPV